MMRFILIKRIIVVYLRLNSLLDELTKAMPFARIRKFIFKEGYSATCKSKKFC